MTLTMKQYWLYLFRGVKTSIVASNIKHWNYHIAIKKLNIQGSTAKRHLIYLHASYVYPNVFVRVVPDTSFIIERMCFRVVQTVINQGSIGYMYLHAF